MIKHKKDFGPAVYLENVPLQRFCFESRNSEVFDIYIIFRHL